jgi:hypothetical protein
LAAPYAGQRRQLDLYGRRPHPTPHPWLAVLPSQLTDDNSLVDFVGRLDNLNAHLHEVLVAAGNDPIVSRACVNSLFSDDHGSVHDDPQKYFEYDQVVRLEAPLSNPCTPPLGGACGVHPAPVDAPRPQNRHIASVKFHDDLVALNYHVNYSVPNPLDVVYRRSPRSEKCGAQAGAASMVTFEESCARLDA